MSGLHERRRSTSACECRHRPCLPSSAAFPVKRSCSQLVATCAVSSLCRTLRRTTYGQARGSAAPRSRPRRSARSRKLGSDVRPVGDRSIRTGPGHKVGSAKDECGERNPEGDPPVSGAPAAYASSQIGRWFLACGRRGRGVRRRLFVRLVLDDARLHCCPWLCGDIATLAGAAAQRKPENLSFGGRFSLFWCRRRARQEPR